MAQHWPSYGYAVLVPDVYYRDGDWAPFDMATAFSDADERKRLFGDDLQGDARHHGRRRGGVLRLPGGAARGQRARRSAPPATAWAGGPRWWWPAGSRARGGGDVVPRRRPGHRRPGSPHLLADQMHARPSTSAAPRTTRRSPPRTAETLDKALTAAGVEHTIEFYPAAHGFAVPDNAAVRRGRRRSGTGTRWRAFFGATPGLTRVLPRRSPVRDHVRVYDQDHCNQPDAQRRGSRIDPVLARSWLLVNGAQYDRFAPAAQSRADIVVLDIEDAVAPKDKAARPRQRDPVAGRRATATGSASTASARRGGPTTSRCWRSTSVGGVMLAMVESVDHVTETAKRLPNVPIVALVETARGLERITEIAAAKGTFRLAFGIGDFRRDTGFGDNPATLAYARSRFTIAAKAAHLPERHRRADRRLERAEAQRGDRGVRRVRHDRQDLPDARSVPHGERGTVPVAGRDQPGPRSSSPSSSATAARSATARTCRASPAPTRSSTWPARTASRPRSSATTTRPHARAVGHLPLLIASSVPAHE